RLDQTPRIREPQRVRTMDDDRPHRPRSIFDTAIASSVVVCPPLDRCAKHGTEPSGRQAPGDGRRSDRPDSRRLADGGELRDDLVELAPATPGSLTASRS